MAKRNPKFDEYIAKSADFAKPVLKHFRKIVHQACPDVEEEMKWSFPHFMYRGMLCGMAAFKNHCAINFWKGPLLFAGEENREAMGQFGRIASLSDLPSDKKLVMYIKKAARLNDEGVKVPKMARPKERKELRVPDYFQRALQKNRKAANAFEKFSTSHRREYVEWITEAKTDATRDRRLATAIEWMSEGKSLNWKYMR